MDGFAIRRPGTAQRFAVDCEGASFCLGSEPIADNLIQDVGIGRL
jgi:hypothetical protein